MFDIGVNLDQPAYLDDLDLFRKEYNEAGVKGIICIASHLDEARQILTHCAPYHDMQVTLGCHPHHASSWTDEHFNIFQTMFANHSNAVAVGETGLDFNRNYSTPDEQIYAFEQQLKLAEAVKKPLFLHERDAQDTMLKMLSNADLSAGGVIHCFTGDEDTMQAYLSLGLHVGITGWLLDERRNEAIQQAVKSLPLDRLLLETDAPYLTPRNIRPRPKRNHPKYLSYIAAEIARIKDLDVSQVIEATNQNTRTLFSV